MDALWSKSSAHHWMLSFALFARRFQLFRLSIESCYRQALHSTLACLLVRDHMYMTNSSAWRQTWQNGGSCQDGASALVAVRFCLLSIKHTAIDANVQWSLLLFWNHSRIRSAKFENENDEASARIVKGRIEKTYLGQICDYIKEFYTEKEGCYLMIKIDFQTINQLSDAWIEPWKNKEGHHIYA